MKKVRVVIVDDSPVCRVELKRQLEADSEIEVCGEVEDGEAALACVQSSKPDLVIMDLVMPRMNGLAAIEQVMAVEPLPILVLTAQPNARTAEVVFEATRRGALDVALKPESLDEVTCRELRRKVRELASVRVVRHVAGNAAGRLPSLRPPALSTAPSTAPFLVGIAASAGGPAPLATILAALPASFAGCICVVQHLPVGFSLGFAEYLNKNTRLEVRAFSEPIQPAPGLVVVAPDARHLVLNSRGRLVADDAPPLQGHRPAADALFESLAAHAGPGLVGVVLSGIGNDGARGLLRMRQSGALTLAQSESSCAVYGMPRAAAESGAAEYSLDPAAIVERLNSHAQARGSRCRA